MQVGGACLDSQMSRDDPLRTSVFSLDLENFIVKFPSREGLRNSGPMFARLVLVEDANQATYTDSECGRGLREDERNAAARQMPLSHNPVMVGGLKFPTDPLSHLG